MNTFLCKKTSKNLLFSRLCEICSSGPYLEHYRDCRAVCFLPLPVLSMVGVTSWSSMGLELYSAPLLPFISTVQIMSNSALSPHCQTLHFVPPALRKSVLIMELPAYIVLLSKRCWCRELADSTSATGQQVSIPWVYTAYLPFCWKKRTNKQHLYL